MPEPKTVTVQLTVEYGQQDDLIGTDIVRYADLRTDDGQWTGIMYLEPSAAKMHVMDIRKTGGIIRGETVSFSVGPLAMEAFRLAMDEVVKKA